MAIHQNLKKKKEFIPLLENKEFSEILKMLSKVL